MDSRYRFRLYLLTALILAGAGSLIGRLYTFQIIKSSEFQQKAPGKSRINIRVPGVRGEIKDRNGVKLCTNTRIYELNIYLEEMKKAWLRKQALKSGETSNSSSKSVDIADIVTEWILPRLEEIGIKPKISKRALRIHYLTHGGLVPYVLPEALDFEQFSRIAEHNLEFPGVSVSSRPQRVYPYGTLACHLLGYIKPWEKGNVSDKEQKSYNHYFGDAYGDSGIEAVLNKELTGPPGKSSLLKDEKGHIIGRLGYMGIPAGIGAEVTLTIDARMQLLTEQVLSLVGRGAAVIIQPDTGEVLAMASVPNYTPNAYIPTISREKFLQYTRNRATPLINRAIKDYQPGSIFKLPVALAAGMNGLDKRRLTCRGSIAYGNRPIKCHRISGHGTLDLIGAIQQSCNPYFMDLANRLGSKRFADGLEICGLGKHTEIRLPGEEAGMVPGGLEWKQEQGFGASMTPATLALSAIGQWHAEATPLQICNLTAAIANGGRLYQPRIVKKSLHPEAQTLIEDKPMLKVDFLLKGMSSTSIETVREGMRKVVQSARGTASSLQMPQIEFAAKTGTVQKGAGNHDAWTTAFAPYNEPRYAITVFVEGGKSGGRVAGSLVNLILRGLLALEREIELPLQVMPEYSGHFHSIKAINLPPTEEVGFPVISEIREYKDKSQNNAPPPRILDIEMFPFDKFSQIGNHNSEQNIETETP